MEAAAAGKAEDRLGDRPARSGDGIERRLEIVVALIDDEEATLKTFRREGSMIRLDPANRQYEPQRYHPDQVKIQGRLAGLIRRY